MKETRLSFITLYIYIKIKDLYIADEEKIQNMFDIS